METLHMLVQRTARAFYSPREVVVLDALVHKRGHMSDAELEEYLHLPKKMVREIVMGLVKQRLVRHEMRSDKKEVKTQYSTPRDYFFIEYKTFVNVVKYKIYHLQLRLREMLKGDESDSTYYECPMCNRRYDALQATRYFNGTVFACPHDKAPLTEIDNYATVMAHRAKQAMLMKQIKPIIELLKKTETLVIPAYKHDGTAPAAMDAKTYRRTVAQQGAVTRQIENMYSLPQAPEITVTIRSDDGSGANVNDTKDIKAPLPHWHSSTVPDNPPGGASSSTSASTDALPVVKEEPVDAAEAAREQDEVDAYYASLAQKDVASEVVEGAALTLDDDTGATDMDAADDFVDDDTLVMVRGEPVPLSSVTEEMQGQMTADEFEAFVLTHREVYGDD